MSDMIDTASKTSTADRWELMPYTPGMTDETPELNGQQYPWGRQGAIHLKDGEVAKDLVQKYDGRIIATKVSSPDVHDRGHRYFFGGWPEMPWKRGQDAGKEDTQIDQEPESLRGPEREGDEQAIGGADQQRAEEETTQE